MFESGQLDYIIHEEGRAAYENSAFQYEFFVKDHLGNVRQVVRAPQSNLRVATMEPEHAVEEEELFQSIKESRQGAAEHNKTPGGYATAWLNADRGRILGPSRSQEIQEGDSIEIGVFGKYVDPKKIRLSPATFARTGMDRKIIRTLGEYGQNLAAAPNEFAIANVIALVIGELNQKPAPEAYMAYALYDSDSNLYEQGKVVLSKKARNKHEELVQKIAIKKDGYIETFLVNETSENVWFDQFRVMSTGPIIVQETHYDPWGLEIKELGFQYGGIKVNPYLYNSKEAIGHLGIELYDYGARMYDPVIGRWSVVDPLADHPKQIGMSPYSAFWNNPIRYNDPDGRCPECEENVIDPTDGQSYTSTGGADYTFGNGEWTRQGGMLNEVTVTAQKPSLLEKGYYRGQAAAQDAWNSPLARAYVPDFVSVGGGFTGIALVGGGTSLEANWVLRGPEASLLPAITTTQSVGGGYSIDATLNIGRANYLGPVNEISRSMLQTSIGDGQATIWGSGGVAAGGKIGVTGSYTPTDGGYGIVGGQLNIGAGLPAGPLPANAAGGVSNTFILYDFHKKRK